MNKKNVEAIYPLSPTQQGMLFHSLYDSQVGVYIEQLSCTLRGTLNASAFRASWQHTVARHPILRTLFLWERRDQPLQVVRRHVEVPWQDHDWQQWSSADQAAQLTALLDAERVQGFDLSSAPLLRIHLIQLAPDTYQLVLQYHHLLMDAWSFALLFREVLAAYSAFSSGRNPSFPPARQYRDYIGWLQQQEVAAAETFWRTTLRGFYTPTPLDTARPRQLAEPASTRPQQRLRLSSDDTAALQAFARQQRLTLNTLVQGAWALLLSRYSGEQDVLFGTVVAGRPATLPGVETIIGPFINTLALRVVVNPTTRVLDWLHHLQQQQTSLEQFAWSPLAQVQSWSELPPGVPLFESILAFESQPVSSAALIPPADLVIDALDFRETTNYPLTVRVVPGAELLLWIDYDPQRFDAVAITRVLRHFHQILEGLIEEPARRLADVPLLSASERQQLLGGQHQALQYTSDLCLHHLFEAQAARTPDAVALVCDQQRVSYRELNQRANLLARVLRARGIGGTRSEAYVGLYLERSVELVVAILAVLKAGGAYVPLDPAYPQERLHWIVSDTRAAVLVTQRSLPAHVSAMVVQHSLAVIVLDDDELTVTEPGVDANLPGVIDAACPAYVIYTSGSTGQPKGVVVTHRNVVRLFAATSAWIQPDTHDVWTLFHSAAFDFSVWELWGALLYGGRLVVVPYLVSRDPEAFAELLHREHVTVLSQTPSAFRQLMPVVLAAREKLCATLRLVIFGGEALEMAMLRPWLTRYGDHAPQLVNMYGITETTVHVTYRPIRLVDLDQGRERVIGQPIPDLQLYLLDANTLEPVPPGVTGEIYVGGAGLARGYLNRPALTAERFIPDPFGGYPQDGGGRLYKTGDTARYLEDGELEYIGRSDQQVKLRGFRIELGEIEAVLRAVPGIRDAVVLLREDHGDQQLVAYVVEEPRIESQESNASQAGNAFGSRSPGGHPVLGSAELRQHLGTRLPNYMVPSAFVFLPALPLTANGKLNRQALFEYASTPEDRRAGVERPFVAPRTPTEQTLASIWSEVLGVARIGVEDSFFALGGDSMRSIQVLAHARLQQLPLTLQQIFETPTLGALARQIDTSTPNLDEIAPVAPFSLVAEQDREQLPADLADAYPLADLQLGMLFHSELGTHDAIYHDIFSFHLRTPLDRMALTEATQQIVAQHAVLRTSFDLHRFSEPLQLVHQTVSVPISFADLRHLVPAEQDQAVQRWIDDEKQRPFDWTVPPLLRFQIHQRDLRDFQLTLSFHHAILDGWSVASLLVELFERYSGLLRGQPVVIRPLQTQFRDLVALERVTLQSEVAQRYWSARLHERPITRLPRRRSHERGVPELGVATYSEPIAPVLLVQLQQLAERAGAPIKSVLLAAHVRMMALLTGQTDVLTGLVANTRPETPDSEQVLGLFLNTLPLRLQLPIGSWLDLVRAVFAEERSALPFRWYTLAEIQQQHGGQPLFETAFNFTHFHVYQSLEQVNTIELVSGKLFQQTNFAFLAHVNIHGTEQARLTLEYDPSQFDPAQIAAIGAAYIATLTAMTADPDQLVAAAALGDQVELDLSQEIAAHRAGESAAQPPIQPARPAGRVALALPRAEIEQRIAAIWRAVLHIERVDRHDNFFDLGGHSLRLVQVRSKLREDLGCDLPMTDLFAYPTISALSQHLADPQPALAPDMTSKLQVADDQIAVIGIACALPDARTPDTFWQQLRDGVESIRLFSDDELLAAGVDPQLLRRPGYVKAGAVLDEIDRFDAGFFGFTPREAEIMDPQQRLFLEYAWAALEDAGYGAATRPPSDGLRSPYRIGVYAGLSTNTYLLHNLASNPELIEAAGGLQTLLANDKDFLPTRVSYKLNLQGPSINVQTACSTSLVAVHLARRALLDGECDLALAGGVSIRAFHKTGYLYEEGSIFSPDGHCRAFDADAQGTVAGNGLGIVVLKRLEQAVQDGDTIYGVIKGSAINNDGGLKVGYTAPSEAGQVEAIRMALQSAAVDPATIGYVEAHGTGTNLGDPIEIAALRQVFAASALAPNSIPIGSVKTNLGHLDAAAGVIGLIKTVLALHHAALPPSLNFVAPNPQLELEHSPFYVNTTLKPWPCPDTSPRRAGVSSFGIGGTNAHVVLEEAPPVPPSSPAGPWQLLALSAKTSASLEQATADLLAYLRRHPSCNLADVAYTLQVGRAGFSHRRTLVCSDVADAVSALEQRDPRRVPTVVSEQVERPVLFMFPGVGAQYLNMGRELYESEGRFRASIDQCAALLAPALGLDLRTLLYPSAEQMDQAVSVIERPAIAMPLLFATEYALAQMWIGWGVRPTGMIGHSLGEYVAATLAGVFSLEDALALVLCRGRLFEQLPASAMLSVALSSDMLLPLLGQIDERLGVAAINGPALCVVAGPVAAIDELRQRLAQQGVECQRLHIAVATHSPLVEPILAEFAAFLATMTLHPPQIAFVSNVTGTWISTAEATDPHYWLAHLRQTVRFAVGMQCLLEQPAAVLLEVGPGRTLHSLVRPYTRDQQIVLTSMRHPHESASDMAVLLQTVGRLWQAQVAIDWAQMYAGERRRRVPLPAYAFDRQRYWIDPRPGDQAARSTGGMPRKTEHVDDWFYLPWWQRTVPPRSRPALEHGSHWLILADQQGFADRLAQRLQADGQHVIIARIGPGFRQVDTDEYVLDVEQNKDYRQLIDVLIAKNQVPQQIVHCWSLTPPDSDQPVTQRFLEAQRTGYDSLILLVQALAAAGLADTVQSNQRLRLAVVSSGLHAIVDGEVAPPELAPLLGPCKVIPQEYPNLTCQSIDVVLPPPGTRQAAALIEHLIHELVAPSESVLAYRGGQRWVQNVAPAPISHDALAIRPLRDRGVYLIVGGLGRVGLVLAEHLARTRQARLVLLGRSALPPRTEWDSWLSTHAESDSLAQKLRAVQRLEHLGAEVLLLQANAADATQMQAALAQIDDRFGALHGVLYTAGLADYGSIIRPLATTGCAADEALFEAKIHGLYVLDRLLDGRALDFCLLFSSVATTLGGLGFSAYSAANLFMDAFAA
ncbi:MAG TPA: amino acid adenylation domain-containing protein, partial [Herpetosiphonaceae bacterium]